MSTAACLQIRTLTKGFTNGQKPRDAELTLPPLHPNMHITLQSMKKAQRRMCRTTPAGLKAKRAAKSCKGSGDGQESSENQAFWRGAAAPGNERPVAHQGVRRSRTAPSAASASSLVQHTTAGSQVAKHFAVGLLSLAVRLRAVRQSDLIATTRYLLPNECSGREPIMFSAVTSKSVVASVVCKAAAQLEEKICMNA